MTLSPSTRALAGQERLNPPDDELLRAPRQYRWLDHPAAQISYSFLGTVLYEALNGTTWNTVSTLATAPDWNLVARVSLILGLAGALNLYYNRRLSRAHARVRALIREIGGAHGQAVPDETVEALIRPLTPERLIAALHPPRTDGYRDNEEDTKRLIDHHVRHPAVTSLDSYPVMLIVGRKASGKTHCLRFEAEDHRETSLVVEPLFYSPLKDLRTLYGEQPSIKVGCAAALSARR